MNIKRYIVAGAAAATLAGGAFAFAANLDVDSDTLASGSTTVNNDCDDVDVAWGPAFHAATNTFRIDDIAVTGGAGCEGDLITLMVEFEDVNSVTPAPVKYEEELGDTTGDYTFTGLNYDAASIKDITVLVTGNDDNAADPVL